MTSTHASPNRKFKASRLVAPKGFPALARSLFRDVGRDRGGAAIVEFALAIMPVFILFFGMVQWSIVAYVHLIVKHAAFVAVRCEAVVNPGMPDAGKETDCTQDAMNVLFAHVAGVNSGDVKVTPANAGAAEQKLDSVTVKLDYQCTIPLGNVIACTSARVMTLTETASFPNQGSAYQSIWVGG
jgi:Flp pilus assembly protein TadG